MDIFWGGGLLSTICPRGQGGGGINCPHLSTRGGKGVKNGQNWVHVVVECPLTGSANSNWCISDGQFFMIRWHYDKKEDIFEIPFSFVITISTYLKNPVSCFTDFSWPYSNERENKNNIASCLWSISDRTNASTEKNIYIIWKP